MVSTVTTIGFQQERIWSPSPLTERGRAFQFEVDQEGNLVYCNGRAVYRIPLSQKTSQAATGELRSSTEARLVRGSPMGDKLAVADVLGNVKIIPYPSFSADGAEPRAMFEGRLLAAGIKDICWDCEGRNLLVVGDGRDTFVAGIDGQSGQSIGEFAGPTKSCNSVSIRPGGKGNSVKVAVASDDFTVSLYEGTPFRLSKTIRSHQGFVTSVAFSPEGKYLASAGADGKIFLYDGEEGEVIMELGEATKTPLNSTITGIVWIDGEELISCSLDGQLCRFSVSANNCVRGVSFKQQIMGIKAAGSNSLCIALLDGSFVRTDLDFKVVAKHQGHTKAVTALSLREAAISYSGDADGNLFDWSTGERTFVDKEAHGISEIFSPSPQSLRLFSKQGLKVISTGGQAPATVIKFDPKILKVSWLKQTPGVMIAACIDKLQALCWDSCAILESIPLASECLTLCISEDIMLIALAMADKTVTLIEFTIAAPEKLLFKPRDAVLKGLIGDPSCLAISPDGKLLAVGDTQRRIYLFDLSTHELIATKWCFHSSTISCLAWSPSGKYLVSGGLDNSLMLWSPSNRSKPLFHLPKAHNGSIRLIAFADEKTVITTGADATIRQWSLSNLQGL